MTEIDLNNRKRGAFLFPMMEQVAQDYWGAVGVTASSVVLTLLSLRCPGGS